MPIDRSRSKRGRPPKTIGQRFATMAWFADVLRLSGAENPYQLGQLLFPKRQRGHGSNLLYQYRNGSVLPGNIDRRLKRVGIHLLASWIWFQYPLWSYLDHRQYELRDVRGLLLNFSDEINELVVHDYFEEGDSFIVTRTPEDWRHRFDRLRSIGNLDAWTGALALLRQLQAVHLDSSEQYHYGCEAVLNMREVVYQHPIFGGFADHLYRWLAFCLHGLDYVATESKWLPLAHADKSKNRDYIHCPWLESALETASGYESRAQQHIDTGDWLL